MASKELIIKKRRLKSFLQRYAISQPVEREGRIEYKLKKSGHLTLKLKDDRRNKLTFDATVKGKRKDFYSRKLYFMAVTWSK